MDEKIYANVDRNLGNLVNGTRQGFGTCFYASEKKYVGEWKNMFRSKKEHVSSYPILDIGGNWWTASDMEFITENSELVELVTKSDVYHYARLYNWNDALQVCPDGWRLPSNDDWEAHLRAVGGADRAGIALKKGGRSGFDVTLSYTVLGANTVRYWTSTSLNSEKAYGWVFSKDRDEVIQTVRWKTTDALVRCVKKK